MCFGVALSAQAASVITSNLLANPGAETGNLTGWTIGGNSHPGVDDGSFDPGIDPHSGKYDFYGHTGSFGTLSQTVLLIGNQGITAAEIDSGTLLADVSFWEQGLNQGTPSDEAQITLTFLGANNVILGSLSTPLVDSHDGSWKEGGESFDIPSQTQSIDYTMDFIRNKGSDNDSFIDDNSLNISSTTITPEPASAGLLFAAGLWMASLLKRR